MRFTELDPEVREKALDGQEDILIKLVEADAAIYRDAVCPRCGGLVSKALDIGRAIRAERIIPRYNMRCVECGALHDPFSGLILEMGNLGRLQPEFPTIR